MSSMKLFSFDVSRMAGGVGSPVLYGYTMRALKFGPTYMDGKDWRAACMRCGGTGSVADKSWSTGDGTCKLCDGKGEHKLPSPRCYKALVWLWCQETAKDAAEVQTVANSEIVYVSSLGEDVLWESEVIALWKWILRNMPSQNVKEFFLSNAPLAVMKAGIVREAVEMRKSVEDAWAAPLSAESVSGESEWSAGSEESDQNGSDRDYLALIEKIWKEMVQK